MEIKEANRKYICEEMRNLCDYGDMDFRESYSGRGMYGKNCVGIVGSSVCDIMAQLMEFIPELLQQSEEDGYEELYDDFLAVMKSANTDNMGRSEVIVYFPSLQMIPDDGDEVEETETENKGE